MDNSLEFLNVLPKCESQFLVDVNKFNSKIYLMCSLNVDHSTFIGSKLIWSLIYQFHPQMWSEFKYEIIDLFISDDVNINISNIAIHKISHTAKLKCT